MRVAQIIDNLYFGGAQTMQLMFAQTVCKRSDIDLTVISLRNDTQTTHHIPEQLEACGARVAFFSARKLFDPTRFWRLINFLHQEQFDVIHTHLPYANIVGILAGRVVGVPVIASLRNSTDDKGRYYFIRHNLETWLLRYLAHRIMAVGYATAEAHRERLGNKPIEAIPNALTIIPPLSPEERIRLRTGIMGDPTHSLFISVGRLAPQKGYSDLITAFAELRRKHPQTSLIIAGKGELYDELKEQIKYLGLNGHAILLGARQDVPRLLAASDIFVSSSHWEGLSVAILEAMAAGLPIVATRVSDTPRVVVDGTGLIVPSKAPAMLAEAMSSFLDDPAQIRSCGAAAQAFIERHHNPTLWANRILDLYESVLETPQPKLQPLN
jgi:glycosyltransferase involved in cell wall biosynthesis